MLCAGIAYYLLAHCLQAIHGKDSTIAASLGTDLKGKASVAIYAAAIPLAFVQWWIACLLYVCVAAMWLIPDRRFERKAAVSPPA
jgi:uncharacterized membrane protein